MFLGTVLEWLDKIRHATRVYRQSIVIFYILVNGEVSRNVSGRIFTFCGVIFASTAMTKPQI